MDESRIKFVLNDAQIEETAGRRKFCLVLDEKAKEYEKRMLCGSQCPYILPMYFLNEDGGDTTYYDFTGLIQLPEYIKRQTSGAMPAGENQKPVCGALDALSGALGCIKGMENYLVFPERITIHPDVFFIDPGNGKITLAFYPWSKPEITFQNRILALIDGISELYHNPETGQYFEKLKDYIHTRNPGLDGLIGMLGTMRREVGYIYWNSKSFRKTEENDPVPDHEKSDGIPGVARFTHGRSTYAKQKGTAGKKLPPAKLIAVQAVFCAALAAAFLSGVFDIVSFAGLAVVAAALDFWLIKKLRIDRAK